MAEVEERVHIGATREWLESAAGVLGDAEEYFVDHYYDVLPGRESPFVLIRGNRWLRRRLWPDEEGREEEWCLRTCEPVAEGRPIRCVAYRTRAGIVAALGITDIPDRDFKLVLLGLAIVPLFPVKTYRRVLAPGIVVDRADVGEADRQGMHIEAAIVRFAGGSAADLAALRAPRPARSKIAERLFRSRTPHGAAVYQHLRTCGFVLADGLYNEYHLAEKPY